MQIEKILKKYKKSITKDRVNIYKYMLTQHIFSSTEIILAFPKVGRTSIFRTINTFLEIGALRSIKLGEKKDFYEVEKIDHHHEHFQCDICKQVLSFSCNDICGKLSKQAEKLGFSLREHSISLFGICNSCNNK